MGLTPPIHPVGRRQETLAADCLQLLRTIGNQRVLHLLESQRIQRKSDCDQALPRSQVRPWEMRRGEIHRIRHGSRLRPEQEISEQGDKYEQDADRVADLVMRKSDSPLQREKREEGISQAPSATAGVLGAGHFGGSSELLPPPVRVFFERRFGRSLAHVRVHTGLESASLARSVNARAFTVRQDIVFGAGQYAPQGAKGLRLIAHELAHVVQQEENSAVAGRVQREGAQPSAGMSSYVWIDAPVTYDPNAPRTEPLVSDRRRWPLPNETPCSRAGDYYHRFWEPNLQYGQLENGDPVWWEDAPRSGGGVQRNITHYEVGSNTCRVTSYPLSRGAPPEEEAVPPVEVSGANPRQLDLEADPEDVYGPVVDTAEDAEIMGYRGLAYLYEDGTIEIFAEGSSGAMTFRPLQGDSSGYEFYDEDGLKVEGLIITTNILDEFGSTESSEP